MWWMGLVAPRHVGSSQIRDQTCVPCIGSQILNHWTTRKVPGFTLGVVNFMHLGKCIMTYLSIWHIYLSYIYLSLCDHTEYFHCPKMSWCSLFFPPTPQRLTFTDYFTIYSFAFPKMSYSWNYTDIIFSDGLFSLSNMHLWFLQVFSWLESSFLLVWNNIPWSGWTTVYLSIYLLRKILAASKSKKSQLCMRQGLSWMQCFLYLKLGVFLNITDMKGCQAILYHWHFWGQIIPVLFDVYVTLKKTLIVSEFRFLHEEITITFLITSSEEFLN